MMPPKKETPKAAKKRSPSAASSSSGIDPDMIAAAVAAALAQLQTTNTVRQLPTVPKFVYDCADPNGASIWFQQLESLFRLQKVTDEQKCALAVNALDGQTFKKVARALLPDPIEELNDFKKLRNTMVGLFEYSVSLFARRYSALNLEWKGPENETIAEYGARIKDMASAFTGIKPAEIETLMLMLGMKDPALEGFRTKVLNQLNKKADTSLNDCLQIMNAALQTEREQKLPVNASVNYVKKIDSKEAYGRHAKDARKKESSSSNRRSHSVTSGTSGASSYSSRRGRAYCSSCGGHHHRAQCKYKDAECYKCGKEGHIQKICKAKETGAGRKDTVAIQNVRINTVAVKDRVNSDRDDGKVLSVCASRVMPSAIRPGDCVDWYNSCDGQMQCGLIVDVCNDTCEIRYGEYNQHYALVKTEDVCAYDPQFDDPVTCNATRTREKEIKHIRGYLATRDHVINGNFGLFDQLEALKFVKRNIAAFGGDPNQITLGGHSAGSTSTHALSFHPETRHLFKQEIHLAGSNYAVWGIASESNFNHSELISNAVGCSQVDTHERKACLKQVDFKRFWEVREELHLYPIVPDKIDSLYWSANFDNDFFQGKTLDELQRDAPKRKILYGLDYGEALHLTLISDNPITSIYGIARGGYTYENRSHATAQKIREFILQLLVDPKFNATTKEEIIKRVFEFYEIGIGPNATDPNHYFYKLTDLYQIVLKISTGTEIAAKSALGWRDQYLYQMDYVRPQDLNRIGNIPGHGYLLLYLCGLNIYTLDGISNTTEDNLIQQNLAQVFYTFIKGQKPSSNGILAPKITENSIPYLLVNKDITIGDTDIKPKVDFWKQLSADYQYDFLRQINL